MFKCLNPNCQRTITFLGRISEEKRPTPGLSFSEVVRVVIEAPCCPFCGSKEFEEIPSNKEETKN